MHLRLQLHVVVVQFHVKISGREDVAEARHRLARLAHLVGHQVAVDLAFQTAAERDQTGGVLGQEFLVDARLVVVAVEVRRRDELDEVSDSP